MTMAMAKTVEGYILVDREDSKCKISNAWCWKQE